MLNKTIKTAVATVITLSFSNNALANEITLLGNSTQAPKAWLDNGKPSGFIVDMAEAVLKNAGITPKVKLAPFVRSLEEAKKCKGLMTGVFKNEERLKHLNYSKGMFGDSYVIVVKKGSSFAYNGLDSLSGKKVGHLKGGFIESVLKNNSKIKLQSHTSPSAMLKMLKSGRIDSLVINPGKAAAIYAAKSANLDFNTEFETLNNNLAEQMNYIVGCKAEFNGEILKKVNQSINELTEQDKFTAIYKQYN